MGQTILSFHQHFVERLENTMQIRKKYYIKDNMGQIILCPIQFLKCI